MRTIRILLMAAVAAVVLSSGFGAAVAGTSFEFHDGMWILSMTPDGKILCGSAMNGAYEAVRWTPETGNVFLGMSSGMLLGTGGGNTRMSADGDRICSSTVNADTTLATPGLWVKGVGWQALIPPLTVGGGNTDGHLGSPYDISDDGSTVVGLCWVAGRGNPFRWTAATNAVNLPVQGPGQRGRANVTNADGSVVGGWTDNPTSGMWQPTVWENGVMTVLNDSEVASQVQCMTPDGSILGGLLYNPAYLIREPTLWYKSGSTWVTQRLGLLPDSVPFDTQCISTGLTADGSVLVGEYLYDLWTRTGFVWTLNEGLMTADEYFAGRGVPVPATFQIGGLSVITPDGNRIAGWGFDLSLPNNPTRGFVVTLDTTSDVPAPAASGRLALSLPSPNPFNPSTSLAVSQAQGGPVNLSVYDVRGALVKVLSDGQLAAGSHSFTWDGRNEQGLPVPSGVYLAQARTPEGMVQTQRLTLTK